MAKRPTYTDKQKDEIFKRILMRVAGGQAIRNVIKNKDVYSIELFYKALNDKSKAKQYARACEERAEVIFEDMFDIADDTGNDIITLSDGRKVENKAIIARDRLRVDTRKWILSKMNPRKYGEKIDLTSLGDRIDPKTVVEFRNYSGIKEEKK